MVFSSFNNFKNYEDNYKKNKKQKKYTAFLNTPFLKWLFFFKNNNKALKCLIIIFENYQFRYYYSF